LLLRTQFFMQDSSLMDILPLLYAASPDAGLTEN
jgi:hypothetical protein